MQQEPKRPCTRSEDACNPFKHPRGTLEQRHPHPKDGAATLDEPTHVYTYHGPDGPVPVPISCSTLLKPYFDDFDGEATARKYLTRWLEDASHPNHKLAKYMEVTLQLDREGMIKEFARFWGDLGADASGKGTEMHKRIELYINGMFVPTEQELQGAPPHDLVCFIKLWETHYPTLKLRPHRTEFSMVYVDPTSGRPVVAGQADGLFVDRNGDYHLFDWKRCDPSKGKIGDQPLDGGARFGASKPKMATGPFANYEKNKYVQYSAQLHLYAEILRQQYGIDCKSCHIVQIHPKLPHAHVIEALDLSDEAHTLLAAACAQASA